MRNAVAADIDLVKEAQSGDVRALGLLLARHQAAMRAVALSILGYGPDAEDAVQEASLIAVRRIGDVRDPAALAPWLRAVVRNACRMQVRSRTAVPVGDLQALAPPSGELDPEALLERCAMRDWVWHAVEQLSPNLRLVTMLRYFTGVTAYEDIAEVCAVPVGTVRSRLNQARAKLSEALLATAGGAHGDVAALTEARRAEAEETLRAAHHGSLAEALAELWWPMVEVTWPQGKRTRGFDYLVRAMERDLGDGVRHRLANVVAGREVVIWEDDLINPPDDPFHCPPGVVWVNFLEEGRIRRVRLFHPVR
ncbi:sigma-70 family RNA polymerase sigma factor [Planotetraspora phitsanulokensis]|uniref:DNA-directed RNA polymerase sigma-70 factor n=1 Tax=Planotetraspora phitsanulokensis TaxID=575192 RepID=A0A8J3UA12_9ACTN|nr:sigma-70 family RNA polymerase sigma factor [Planotetraspora phitsanulokensis]GII41378.1 DNA-directed RNA polymerase sigma-70 factor [Planotetraspora phitsanulokensis]